jgi:predicted phage terminase large subunit-like protein
MNCEQQTIYRVRYATSKIPDGPYAQPTFAQGLVYAPVRGWSQMVIDEMELFPKGRYDDLTDSTTMAVSFLRTSGIPQTDV